MGLHSPLHSFYLRPDILHSANNYQNEESELWIGEWLEKRGVRDQMVIATKFTTGFRSYTGQKEIQSNFQGNSAKSLHVSLNASLKKLKTDYIDLLYLHWYDYLDELTIGYSLLTTLVGGTSAPAFQRS